MSVAEDQQIDFSLPSLQDGSVFWPERPVQLTRAETPGTGAAGSLGTHMAMKAPRVLVLFLSRSTPPESSKLSAAPTATHQKHIHPLVFLQ